MGATDQLESAVDEKTKVPLAHEFRARAGARTSPSGWDLREGRWVPERPAEALVPQTVNEMEAGSC